jgi:hypothetical protein
MPPNKGVYEYIAVYVDVLLIEVKEPSSIIMALENKHQFKLKGLGPLQCALGYIYFLDDKGTVCFGPRKYKCSI